jgi:hypothetical protein
VSSGATFEGTVNIGALANLILRSGSDLTLMEGDFTATKGKVTLSEGDLEMTLGNFLMTDGNLTMTAGNLTMSSGDLLMSSGDLTMTLGDLTLTSGDINLSTGKDIYVAGHGLQEQIAYLYSYLFNQSYASIFAAGDNRTFDEDGDAIL